MLNKTRPLLIATIAALLFQGFTTRAAVHEGEKRMITVEIRAYNLKPGAREEFHRLATEKAIPMLRKWKIDVIAHGPSAHDENSYFLIRGFPNLAERQRMEDAFYGSAAWQQGPRDAVLARIDSYTTIVLELDEATVRGLRNPR
jgi:hypothetical protein